MFVQQGRSLHLLTVVFLAAAILLPDFASAQSNDSNTVVSHSGTIGNYPIMDDRNTPSIFTDSNIADSKSLDLDRFESNVGLWQKLGRDQKHFYSADSLTGLGLAFGASAAIANTNFDSQILEKMQKSVRDAPSHEWFEYFSAHKELGNGYYTLPLMGVAWITGEIVDGPPALERVGEWGARSTRGFVVGAPPLVAMQLVTGASRPNESTSGSEWHPFRDNNGVSGHAFMSSLPFITAAKMSKNRWKKAFWYTLSAIGPLSRVNDASHYPSQAGLGWMMAFAAASSIDETETGRRRHWSLAPNSNGIGMQFRW